MSRLNLKFLEEASKELNPIEETLHDFGKEIYEYAKKYFNYIVTTTSYNNTIEEASLYIIVPEIGYDYKVLTIEYKNVETVIIKFFTLKTDQVESSEISIKEGWDKVKDKIAQMLNTTLANQTFSFLVNQVDLKRESQEEE